MRKLWKKIAETPHLFAKLTVLWCVGFGSAASYYALRIMSHTGHDPSTLLGVILAFFGGELLFLCMRTILKKDKEKEHEESY